MTGTSSIFKEDIESALEARFIPWDRLRKTTILVTGATGLIGSTFIRVLVRANKEKKLDLTIMALVRDERRAKDRFAEILPDDTLSFVVGSVEKLPAIDRPIDYILHAASRTASKEFVQHGVETIRTSVDGTFNLLNLAKEKGVKGVVYLSSMEVYGYPERGHKVSENEIGAMSPLDLRNSYPISKMMCEAMCCAYAAEYDVPAMICRLTQTIGPGVNYDDNRIFAYFGRCVKEKQNIVLKTKGETERSYLHATDAVTAILTIMLKGKPGCAYNAADESTYCSVVEMAERLAEDCGIRVEFDIQNEEQNGFPRTIYMDLDTTVLRELGWMPHS